MSYLPDFDPGTGLLPPGRHSASLDVLYSTLVLSARSPVRQELWDEWGTHRAAVEALAGEITRVWVAGSFVSDKAEPGDIDVTYLVRAQVFDSLDPATLADLDDLTLRGWCVRHDMRVDAHLVRLPTQQPLSAMIPSMLTQLDDASFRDLGLYDEVWQRVKLAAPNGTSGLPRRGYVEVLL